MSGALDVLPEALDSLRRTPRGLYARDAARQAPPMDRRMEARTRLRLVRTAPRTPQCTDEQVQRAIALMRAEPALRWTVSSLARRVGLSRPAFARRFGAATGTSPLRYLTRLRMQRAAELLRGTELGLARIAQQVGYSSEFAFNRAFKRVYRVAPGGFRRAPHAPVFRAAA
jgi:AraC-like DNA-binding protein